MGKKGERSDELLLKAAEALARGAIPLSHDWILEHDVKLEEADALATRISVILKGFMTLDRDDQADVVLLGAVAGEPGVDIGIFKDQVRMRRARKRVKEVCGGKS